MCTINLLARESRLHNDGSYLVKVYCGVRYGFLAERYVIIRVKRNFNAESRQAILTTMFLIYGKLKMGIMARLRSIVLIYVLLLHYVLRSVSN